jgi:hypothetical protein
MITYSVGELIDKLAIIHLKIWHLEEDIAVARENGIPDENIEKMCDQVVNLNTTRNKIVQSIDEMYEAKRG